MTLPSLLELPAPLIDDVCFGLAPLADIFLRYGYTAADATQFGQDPRFLRHITLRTAELDKEGLTHKARVGRLAEKAMATAFMRLDDPSVPFSAITDIYRAAAKNAGFEPKAAEVAPGSGFSINIVFPNSGTPPTPVVISAMPPTPQTFDPAEFEVID